MERFCRPAILRRPRVRTIASLIIITFAVGCQTNSPPTSTAVQVSTQPSTAVQASAQPAVVVPASVQPKIERQPIPGGPVLLDENLNLRKVSDVEGGEIGLALNPITNELYLLHPTSGLFRVAPNTPSSTTKAASVNEISSGGVPAGMAFGPDGSLFVISNRKVGSNQTQAIIRRSAAPLAQGSAWQTLATTEPYQLSGTYFDHLYNGIVVDPEGRWIYINAGSRTDHGEVQSNKGAFPETREVPLTAKIFRLPATAIDLVLSNDEAALQAQGLIFAKGTRNAYDLEFAPNGDLFAVDNGPDADYPDELNWIREGRHYGFPWKFGNYDNPQQFADYDSRNDVNLHPDFSAVDSGTYKTDPTFPKPVGEFTGPVINHGPDAANYRGSDGKQRDAFAEGKPLHGFTPHRSPLGLVFTAEDQLPQPWRGGNATLKAFMLSWGAAGGTLSDTGQDVLYLELHKRGDSYEVVTRQVARNFKNPISAVLTKGRLYILEYAGGAIWELTFGQT